MNDRGKKYEDLACNYIKRKLGYKIIERNYNIRYGEIDIIALEKKTVVFIEVKGGKEYYRPRLRVDETKMKKIELTANFFLRNYEKNYIESRLDVIEVLDNGKINHFKGISRW
ncbi:MAG: putative endonuclease [Kosmotogales bacterium]|nr:putative endonuclease [Kosmotogales bacterium]